MRALRMNPGAWPRVLAPTTSHVFPGDAIPADTAGRLVALADRMDTLTGIFAVGLKPTGNKDPYALRRAALGVIRILDEGQLHLAPGQLIDLAAAHLSGQVDCGAQTLADVREFILDRLRQYLRSDHGGSAKEVAAVLAAELGTIPDLLARLRALQAFMQGEAAESLVAANKRIGNILKGAETGDVRTIDVELLHLSEEQALFDEIDSLSETLEPLFEAGDYTAALTRLAKLKGPVDAFFDHVMVMDENPDIQRNRVSLLSRTKSLFDRVADFSQAA